MSNNRNRNRRPREVQQTHSPILPAMAEQVHEAVDVQTATMSKTVDELNEKTLNEDLEVVSDILDGRYHREVPLNHVEATVRNSIAWLMGRIDNPQDLEYLAVMLDIFVEEVKSGETIVEVDNED